MDKQKVKFIHASSVEELETETNALLEEGYRLHGNVAVSSYVIYGNDVYYFYVQTMMLFED